MLQKGFRGLILALAVMVVATGVIALPVLAAGEGPSFTVEPVYPENQRQKSGYFDIRVQPGQEQELVLLVHNGASEDMEVEVEAVNASTAPDGYIDYATPGIQDSTMQLAFVDMARVDQDIVRVPANGQAEVRVRIQVPEEAFDGMVLGGIRVMKINNEAGEGMITNVYQYALAVAVTENDNIITPEFELVDVQTGLENYRAAVTATIRNPRAVAAKDVDVQTGIYQAGEAEAFFSFNKKVTIAPNSTWDCVFVDQAGFGYPAGDYTFRMRMELDGQVWEFERDFVITRDEASYINDNAVNQQQIAAKDSSFPVWVVVLLIAGILLMFLLLILLLRMLRRGKKSGQ